jgi:hypothetical protein
MAADAAAVERTWSRIDAGIDSYLTVVQDSGDGKTSPAALQATLMSAIRTSWSRVGPRADDIRQTASGADTLSPPVSYGVA